jgi:hypothetical protein
MKIIQKSFLIVSLFTISFLSNAQSADDIIGKYLTQIGGADKWKAIKSFKMTGKVKTQGMELPLVGLQKAPNSQKMTVNLQGKQFVFTSFDGTTSWATAFTTMKAEKSDAETSYNMIEDSQFLDPFIDYAVRGYKVSLEGSETIEGTDCHKIKLTRKPVKVDGKDEENIYYYFFDKENNVPILSRTLAKTGQAKGSLVESVYSNFQEVNGLIFPFEVTQKFGGQVAMSIIFEKIEVDFPIDNKEFAFPE